MKKLRILLLSIVFVITCIGTALASPTHFEKVYSSEDLVLEIDMGNISFHKLDGNTAIEYISRVTDVKANSMMASKIYVIPDLSKFRILEYSILDLNKKIITDESTKPSEWSAYKNDSPTTICVNYIINNYKKK